MTLQVDPFEPFLDPHAEIPVVICIALDHGRRRRLAAMLDGSGVLMFARDIATARSLLGRQAARRRPAGDQPGADQPTVDHPSLDRPSLDHPSLDHPSLDHSSAGHPVGGGHPAGEHSRTDRPAIDLLTADQPGADRRRVVRAGELEVDRGRHRARWRDTALPLTQRERELLACLASEPAQVWTYQQLYAAAWPGRYLDPGPVHAAVKRLRRKLREAAVPVQVAAVRGVGYELTQQ